MQKIPFGSATERPMLREDKKDSHPGPGSYKSPSLFKNSQVFHDIYDPGTYYMIEDGNIKKRIKGYLPYDAIIDD